MAVSAYDSMAWHNDCHRVLAVRWSTTARGTLPTRSASSLWEIVSPKGSKLQRLPSSNLKGSADETNGKVELEFFSIEILIELPGGFGETV